MNYKVTLTFTEDLLGTVPQDKEIYETFIAGKAAELGAEQVAQELETVIETLDEKGKTGFHQLADGTPILYDYVIRGFFKDACGMLRRVDGSRSSKVTAYKKIIDGLVFVHPRRIPIEVSGEMGVLQRPLRAETAQGPRVALAYSDSIPAGSTMEFSIQTLDDKAVKQELIEEWLQYGSLRGLGQWRNGSFGRFEYSIEPA